MRRYSTNLSFVDMLFNLLIGFTSLFIIAFMLINPVAEEGKVTPITEFMITATWDPESIQDMDLWIRGPSIGGRDTIVGYQNKDGRYIILDRDDLGISNDTIMVNGFQEIIKRNVETVTINAIVPGEYVIAVHYFGPNRKEDYNNTVEVEIQLVDMHPYRIVYTGKRAIPFRQEVSYISFVVTEDGKIRDMRDDIKLQVRPVIEAEHPVHPAGDLVNPFGLEGFEQLK